jgi:general secretion pathway protein K
VNRRRERGVALVMVLGMVALVSAWAATALEEDWISLRQTENMALSTQAWMAAESGLELARVVLREDANDSQTDDLSELWAQPTLPFAVDAGAVTGTIVDANRYINLNDLVDANGEVQDDVAATVRRLFMLVGIPDSLVDALADWIDADDAPYGTHGAESSAYAGKPYGVKNAPLDRLEEVLLVDGFEAEMLDTLRNVVVVRPGNGTTPININTAQPDVLLALTDAITESDVDAIVEERQSSPYASVQALTTQPRFAAWAAGLNVARLSVVSDAFIVRAQARFGRVRWGEEMMLGRQGAALNVMYRQRMGWNS